MVRHFFPPAVLLDRDRADDTVRLGIDKHEEWYTHLSVRPKRQPWKPAVVDSSLQALVVVMNADVPTIPRNMPCVIRYSDDYGQSWVRYDVRKWQVNPKGGVDTTEFVDPRKRDGWKIVSWPSLLQLSEESKRLRMDKYE